MLDLFNEKEVEEIIKRVNKLKDNSLPLWGKMYTPQMLAHCNVAYQYAFEPEKFKKPGLLKSFFLRKFVKDYVISHKPYKRSSRTAPEFIISDFRDFEIERKLLIENILKTQQLGESFFEGRENISFGKLTAKEWNVLFSKHLDYHLKQFNV